MVYEGYNGLFPLFWLTTNQFTCIIQQKKSLESLVCGVQKKEGATTGVYLTFFMILFRHDLVIDTSCVKPKKWG